MFEGPPQVVMVAARGLRSGGEVCGNVSVLMRSLSPKAKARKIQSWKMLSASLYRFGVVEFEQSPSSRIL